MPSRIKQQPRPPRIVALAGPNGADKSTTAERLLRGPIAVDEFVNADVIAQGLSGFAPERVAMAAGRVMMARLHALAIQQVSFAFETTLSGVTYARRISEWKRLGYHIKLIFLSLATVDMAVARVSARVAQGGHGVPEVVIRRRFEAGLRNFDRVYKPLVNTWVHYDNSGPLPRRVKGKDNE